MAIETLAQKRTRGEQIIERLDQEFSDVQIALVHSNPFELLIATILSAQCTDERVNKVTPDFFKAAPTPEILATLPLKKIEKLIGSVNYFRTKSKNIKACAEMLLREFGGAVPTNRDQLVRLPGVGRKTANVVMGNAFNHPSMVVDTHVKRLSHRLKLSNGKSPEEIESQLERIVDRSRWVEFSHLLINHGRKYCKALKPQCLHCPIKTLCPSRIHENA